MSGVRRPGRLERVTDVTLAASALLVAGILILREFRPAPAEAARRQNEYVENWERFLTSGIWIGPGDASVTIIEFADLECPACRLFHGMLRDALAQIDDPVALVFVHFPLEQHRFARPAARVLECAAEYLWPSVMPPFVSRRTAAMGAPFSPTVLATSDGRLLIRRAPSSSTDSTLYDIVDRRGALTGKLMLPSNEAVVGFGLSSVYIVETAEFGLQILRRHVWPQ